MSSPPAELKLKPAEVALVGFEGFAVIDTVGALVSTVQVDAANALVLPAASVACTWKRCGPSASPL